MTRPACRSVFPWGDSTVINDCPVNRTGDYVDINMTVTEREVHFDPWPFGVDAFEVGVHGRLLNRTHFPQRKRLSRGAAPRTDSAANVARDARLVVRTPR